MTFALPELRVGDPVCHKALSVFPLFSESDSTIEYRLSEEAFADNSLVVEEISEGGSVPYLAVENKSDMRVLFLEGEELVGAKQNRILNTSVLVPAHTKIKIPVTCVERGRWRYTSRRFGASGHHSPSRMRATLKRSVHRSLKKEMSYMSDQGAVWKEVAFFNRMHGVSSKTEAVSEAFHAFQGRIDSFSENVQYVEKAIGMVVALRGRIVALDVFDKPSTCRKVWKRMLSGVVFDALEPGKTEERLSKADVEQRCGAIRELPWKQAEAVGEGEEYRTESRSGEYASALLFEKTVVHGSVVASL